MVTEAEQEREDIVWLLNTLANANSVIESEGLDDDEELADIQDRMEEIADRFGIKRDIVGEFS
jgi:archaellum component FlaC